MAKGRLTIFLPSLAGGGAERAFGNVANGFAELGVDVTLVLASATGPYLDNILPTVRIVDLKRRSVAAAIPSLVRHLHQFRPDAILSAMSHANVATALAWRLAGSSARLVLSERAHFSSVLEEYRDPSMRFVYYLMRLTYPWAKQIIAVSEGVASDLMTKLNLNREKVTVIYNPVVDPLLLREALASPRHSWLSQKQTPVIVTVGRLIRQKDFATLIRAFALVRERRTLRLVIFGEGLLRDDLRAQAQNLGVDQDIDFPGFVANPFSEMGAADLFVLSSRFEGLPGVLIQAMACGTPVVSTDCPSGPHEILEGGRWGQLVPVGDPAAMAKAIEVALDDPAPIDVRIRAKDFSYVAAIDRYAEVLGLSC